MNATRHARFLVNVASSDALDVRQFTVQERISSLFSVMLTVVTQNTDLDFEAIIGQPAQFEIQGGIDSPTQPRLWTGVCSEIHEVAVEDTGLSTYTLEIVPTLWLATQRRNHRMFQLLSDVDIALELLSDWGIDPVQHLSSSYKKRKYRVQYGESDYTFLCRILEDAGVSFYFVADGGQSRLVLSDAPQSNDLRTPLVTFRDRPGDPDLEHVTALRIGRRVRPGRYTLRDHDYRRQASFKLLATAGLSGVEGQLERFHYMPGAFLFESTKGEATPHADDKGRYRIDDAEGAAMAQRRLDARRSEATTIAFETNVVDLAPGIVIALRQHPRRDLDEGRRLLIIETRMTGTAGQEWKIHCEARKADLPFRPTVATPKPTVNGVESATVVGPSGEEIHTDEFGRVRCHFHWDRESQMDENSSCWIHVSQPWGGTGFGGVNLPRVGQEVLVDFLGGDPDRPVIIGRLYTNLQRVPYDLPKNKTQSGWKSNSTTNTGGYNEMMFEDAAGQELLRMQAEKDLKKLVKHDESVAIGNDRTKQVGRDDSHVVGRDRTRQVGRNEAVTVANNRTKTVGGNEDSAIGRNQSQVVGLNRSAQVGVNQAEVVGSNMSLTVGASMTVSVGGAKTETIGGASTETVGGAKTLQVGGSYGIGVAADMGTTVGGNQSEAVAGAKIVQVGEVFDLVCGASKVHVDAGGIVSIEATSILLKASGPIAIEAGATVKVQASGSVTVLGSTVSIN